MELPNSYVYCKHASKITGKRRGRHSGGLAVVVKKNLKPGVKVIKNTAYGIWVKIDKHFFRTKKDIYVCGVYIPPQDSPYKITAPYELIEKDITELSTTGHIILMGDFNARTGNKQDILQISKTDKNMFMALNSQDNNIHIPTRHNTDDITNEAGRRLTELCSTCNLHIMNGRTLGDVPGRTTNAQFGGCSAVDYGLASIELRPDINFFNVTDLDGYSDHSLIKTNLELNPHAKPPLHAPKLQNTIKCPITYKLNEENKSAFLSAIETEYSSSNIEKVLQSHNINSANYMSHSK